MDIGDTFTIKNRKYTIIEVIRKRHIEHDLLLCTTRFYKECFQRIDLEEKILDEQIFARGWSEEEDSMIKEQLKNGKTVAEISKKFINPNRTEQAVERRAYNIRKELKNERMGRSN